MAVNQFYETVYMQSLSERLSHAVRVLFMYEFEYLYCGNQEAYEKLKNSFVSQIVDRHLYHFLWKALKNFDAGIY